jgi:hypothetical protein
MKFSLSTFALTAGAVLGLTSPLSAHQETAGNLKIGHPWIREAKAGYVSTYCGIIEVKNDGD